MKLLTLPTSEYLLDIGLEEIHIQSREWLNKVLFWKDEVDFFYKVVEDKKKQLISIPVQNNIWHIEKDMALHFGNKLSELQNSVRDHENYLKTLIINNGNDEESYRDVHKNIAIKLLNFEMHFLIIKKNIHEMIEQVENNEAKGNDVTKNIFERRSVRKYKDIPVKKSILNKILKAGTMAPSASNKQPWKFHVLTKKETIHNFSKEIAKAAMKESSKTAIGLFSFPDGEEQMKISDMVFYHAPVVVFISSPKDDEWADLDIGMCSQNIMLAAKSFGLESCPIGFAKYVEKADIYSHLNIDPKDHVNLAIVLGYGDETPKLHDRKKEPINFIE